MDPSEHLYLELGKLAFTKLDALATSTDPTAPELDFFLGDGAVVELMNRIVAAQGKTCPSCRFANPDEALFCVNCGTRLESPTAPGAMT